MSERERIEPEGCAKSEDGTHCVHWFDGSACHYCGAPALPLCGHCDGRGYGIDAGNLTPCEVCGGDGLNHSAELRA